jgi:hypothetical protein
MHAKKPAGFELRPVTENIVGRKEVLACMEYVRRIYCLGVYLHIPPSTVQEIRQFMDLCIFSVTCHEFCNYQCSPEQNNIQRSEWERL